MKSAKDKGKPMSFMEFAEKYATEEACREKMFEARWPEGFVCPKCGEKKCCFITSRNAYQCNRCKHRTTPKVGALMEDSPLPYKTWLWAIYLVATDKRGISGKSLQRQLHVTYKTAWYSGNSKLYENAHHYFDYIKLGKYIKELGGLNSSTTNQRFYRIENERMIDMTYKFYKQ